MNLTHKDIEEITALLEASHFDELVVETAQYKLTLRRGAGVWTQERQTQAKDAPVRAAHAAAGPHETVLAPGEIAVRPPLPGTFYRAPKPGAEPFVAVGSRVAPDSVVCIIETMKLMTPVLAGAHGTVAEILVENGTLVEQGAVLMKLKP